MLLRHTRCVASKLLHNSAAILPFHRSLTTPAHSSSQSIARHISSSWTSSTTIPVATRTRTRTRTHCEQRAVVLPTAVYRPGFSQKQVTSAVSCNRDLWTLSLSNTNSTMSSSVPVTVLQTLCDSPFSPLEHEVYSIITSSKHPLIDVPEFVFIRLDQDNPQELLQQTLLQCSDSISATRSWVIKGLVPGVLHKTDLGLVHLDVTSSNVAGAYAAMHDRVSQLVVELGSKTDATRAGVLIVEQVNHSDAFGDELILGAVHNEAFGPLLSVGIGGASVDFMQKSLAPHMRQLFIPALLEQKELEATLHSSPLVRYLCGFPSERRMAASEHANSELLAEKRLHTLVKSLQHLASMMVSNSEWNILPGSQSANANANANAGVHIDEIEMNPVVFRSDSLCALDGVLRLKPIDSASKPFSFESDRPISKIQQLLQPKSAAVIGASEKNHSKPANTILRNLLDANTGIKAFVVHPRATTDMRIEDCECISSLVEIPACNEASRVDLLVVAVPADQATAAIITACENNIAESMLIVSAGFGETVGGQTRNDTVRACLQGLDADHVRPLLNGPNTVGNIALVSGSDAKEKHCTLQTVFVPDHCSSRTGNGLHNAALVTQSGAFMLARLSDMANHVYPAMNIAVGNQLDLSAVDVVEYLATCDAHRSLSAIGVYLEGLQTADGVKLMHWTRKLSEQGRRVVMYKAGRTPAGQDAAKGHTASSATDYRLSESMLSNAGLICAQTIREFEQSLMAVAAWSCDPSCLSEPGGTIGLAALSNAGFEKCAIGDHLDPNGKIQLATLSTITMERINSAMHDQRLGGIVDVGSILDVTPIMGDKGYIRIIEALLDDPAVELGIFGVVPETPTLMTTPERAAEPSSLLQALLQLRQRSNKPFAVILESGRKYDFYAENLIAGGIPCFRRADEAVRVADLVFRGSK
jgi:acyl-CoA synthetase (NDP forming)